MTALDHEHSAPPRPSFFKRALRRVGILTGTALVGALAVGAVMFSTDVIAQNTVRIDVETGAAPLTVTVQEVVLRDSYSVPQDFIGRVEPRQDTTLGFEAGGTLATLLVDEGDRVSKGQVLAELDTRSLGAQLRQQRAALAALEAQLELAKLTFERQQALAERNFASLQRADEARLAVTELEARLLEREAAIIDIEVQLDKATLRAPFDGEVDTRHVDEGARVGPSAPILDIQEVAAPQVRIGLLPELATELAKGDTVTVVVNGETYAATFASRRAEIDAITRTLPVLFDLQIDDGQPRPSYGAVARLTVERPVDERGAWVPLSALSEGPRGLWQLMVIESSTDGRSVAMEAVEVIYANEAQAFVRGGLSDSDQILADGVHRLAPGQAVLPVQGS
ncbi:MAG: efflux RND transporter periplasmic adaptor subunit [Pseudomonadota bacterium]